MSAIIIPVEALVKWNGHANKLPKGSFPKTELYSSCNLSYVMGRCARNPIRHGRACLDT